MILASATILVVILCCAAYLLAVEQRYRAARASAQHVREQYATSDAQAQLSLQHLPTLAEDLAQLESDLAHLQALVDAPVLGRIARHAPVVGPDIKASQDFIDLGRELTSIAHDAAQIANEVRLTLEQTGMSTGDQSAGPTWLDVVRDRNVDIEDLDRRLSDLIEQRESLDEDRLPETARSTLPEVDRMLARASSIRDEYIGILPLLDTAFGARTDANYVLLLQNREEVRPAGGFPGTFATVVIHNGQLAAYDVYDTRKLDTDYVERRSTVITSPGPIREVLGQPEFLPHDALWSPDFAESARTFESMYATADWPSAIGIIGIDDSVVGDILAIVGSYEVEIDGHIQAVTADNFMQLIEARRDQTWTDLAAHKQVVSILGKSLIDQIKSSNFDTKKRVYFALRDAADRRQIQIYMLDPAMQAEVVARGWNGALIPDDSQPTLATTVAGLTGGKKSLTIFQESEVELESSPAGHRVRWTIMLDHRGDPKGNQVYNGYEYAWLSVYLPDGARVIKTSRKAADVELADDSRALSFGIGLLPGTTETTTIEFEMPETNQLVFRRQAGLNDVSIRIVGDTRHCSIDWSLTLNRDMRADLTTCSVSPLR